MKRGSIVVGGIWDEVSMAFSKVAVQHERWSFPESET